MEDTRLAAADAAYAAGDWTTAAREYLASAAAAGEGAGYAYHRAGNALMKLKRLEDACAVYDRALKDPGYADRSAVACNLGNAKAALGALDDAAKAFEQALSDPAYASRFKALQGAAGAYYQMGRIEDAAEAYRQAALDEANPDPGKSLNNLGLCFAAMERPEDAVEAYRAAVELDGYQGRGRAAANLGMAYAALGMHQRAVEAFDRARDEFGHEFSPAMEAAYRASVISSGSLPGGQPAGIPVDQLPPDRRPPIFTDVPRQTAVEDNRFFTMTDDDMKQADREARRRERQERTRKPMWVSLLVWGAVALLVASAVVGAYLTGLGYPTQQMTVEGMLKAYAAGESVARYWVAVPAEDVDEAMARSMPLGWKSYEIKPIEQSARTSSVEVTVTLPEVGVQTYQIMLVREGVGWKVNGVRQTFDSMQTGI